MSIRIPQLTETPLLTGNELIEVAVPDGSSSTGYKSRFARSSLLMGGLPFRHTIDLNFSAMSSGSYASFTIPYSDLVSTSLFPTEAGHGKLAMAIMNINLLAAFESYDDYPYIAPFNSTILVNKVGAAMSDNEGYSAEDQDKARVGTFSESSDYTISRLDTSVNNDMNYTAILRPSSVSQITPYSDIVVECYFIAPSNRSYPNGYDVKLKGYVDVVAAFADFPSS